MRGGVAAALVLVFLLAAVPLAGAGSKRPAVVGSMRVTASPHETRAHAVRLKLTLRYEMQCGYPGAGLLVVTFPSAMKLPAEFAAGAVRLAGDPVAANVDESQVTVSVAPHKGVLCNVMAPGSLKLVFTRAAKLSNPARAGSYLFRVTHRAHAFTAKLAIK